MLNYDVINLNNEKVDSVELSEDVFAAPIRKYLLSEIVNWQRAKTRVGTQSAKTKGEVHGTTKKPFAQKGRGCARQGSMKNPHQRGGGVAFAPKPRDYSFAMPKNKRRVALAIALSARVKEKGLKILQNFDIKEIKTKQVSEVLNKLDVKSTLIVDTKNEFLKKSTKNLAKAKYLDSDGINVLDVLQYPNLLLTQNAVKNIEKQLCN